MPNEDEKDKYSSKLEEYISVYVAAEILSNQGRGFIIVTWLIVMCFTAFGAYNTKLNFSKELFMVPGSPVTKFMVLNIQEFKDGSEFKVYHILHDIDVSS